MDWAPEPLHGRQLLGGLPASAFDRLIADKIEHTNGHARHTARSAIHNLARAWRIKRLDPEIAVFRAINAEEEAVTAVIRAIIDRKYPLSGKLSPRNHLHKAAVRAAFQIIAVTLHRTGVLDRANPRLWIDSTDLDRPVFLTLDTPLVRNGKRLAEYPVPPLHFTAVVDDVPYDFAAEIRELEADAHVKQAIDFVRERARERNVILYASAQGLPAINPYDAEKNIRERKTWVFRLLATYLLIADYSERQLFVEQAIRVVLAILGKLSRPGTPTEG